MGWRAQNMGLTLEQRFWEKVKRGDPTECWEWIGSRRLGYGKISLEGRDLRHCREAPQC